MDWRWESNIPAGERVTETPRKKERSLRSVIENSL
jgi:hypothetical protein